LSRDGTGTPSIRQSKVKKARQKINHFLRLAKYNFSSSGSDDCPYGMRGALYQGASGSCAAELSALL